MNKQQRIQSLSKMTVANGCTESEAKTAREKLAKMMGAAAAERKVADAEKERRRSWIAEQEKAASRANSLRALQEFQAKLAKDWEELGYDSNEDYREFKKKNWWGWTK